MVVDGWPAWRVATLVSCPGFRTGLVDHPLRSWLFGKKLSKSGRFGTFLW